MIFWHGGDLSDISNTFKQQTKRQEYGPGLYLTTSYDVVSKYIKGSRKLYRVEVALGNSLEDSDIPYDIVINFLNELPKSISIKLKSIIDNYNKDGFISAEIINNLFVNNNLLKPEISFKLKNFYLENNIDYSLVNNAFGWGEDMMILFNTNKIINVERIGPKDKIDKFDLHKEGMEISKRQLQENYDLETLDSLNPTGSIFVDYNPDKRANSPLAKNITTLDKTIGGNPKDEIIIYRGVPKEIRKINAGDFITTNKKLAKDYAGTGNVLMLKVKKGDILDDIEDNGSEEYIYRPNAYKLIKEGIEIYKRQLQDEEVIAYHGGPHSFDKFSTQYMGTGEGANTFGWGLYFTDLEDIARDYANRLYDKSKLEEINKRLSEISKELDKYQSGEYGKYNSPIGYKLKKEYDDLINSRQSEIRKNKTLYKVSLHKGKTPEQYTWLEWDKEIKKNIIILLFNKLGLENDNDQININYEIENFLKFNDRSGEGIYKYISNQLGSDKEASLFLLRAGIDGIKYPAESIARGTTSDNARGFNYVVFDENAVNIEKQTQFEGMEISKKELKNQKVINAAHTYITRNMGKGSDYAPNVHELQKWIDDNPEKVKQITKGELEEDAEDVNFMLEVSKGELEEAKKKKADRCTRIAKRKYDVWPSAYSSAAVVRCRRGKIWKGLKENWEDTSWANDGEEVTLKDLLNLIKDYPIVKAPIEKVKKIVIKKDSGGIESNRLNIADFKYPIIIIVDDSGNYQYILDGNHRANKAIDNNLKFIPAKLVNIKNLPQEFQNVLAENDSLNEKTDFSKEKKQGLHGWFARQGGKGKSKGWVDCNTCRDGKCKSCGRKEGESRSKYPACRPTPSACKTKGKGRSWGKKSKLNEDNQYLLPQEINEILKGYIETALWTEEERLNDEYGSEHNKVFKDYDNYEDKEDTELDKLIKLTANINNKGIEKFSKEDIEPDSLIKAYTDIKKFIQLAGDSVYEAIYENGLERLGTDIWFTRNSHGSGFFDHSYDYDDEKKLIQAAKSLGSVDLYINDNLKLSFSNEHLHEQSKQDIERELKLNEIKNLFQRHIGKL